MACHLFNAKPLDELIGTDFHEILNQNTTVFIPECVFNNADWKISAILFRPQCGNSCFLFPPPDATSDFTTDEWDGHLDGIVRCPRRAAYGVHHDCTARHSTTSSDGHAGTETDGQLATGTHVETRWSVLGKVLARPQGGYSLHTVLSLI